ncbi:hypothetical protein [Methanogenium cariaci]|uniref:hypothetical protein n=1 Tax=Methanogenium cariaci TaxID=2197 RepID=UPI0007831E35|nr:hypothetical protein [Methanogenium cariaci]
MTKRLATHEPPIEDCSSFLRDICTGFETSQIFMTAHEMGGSSISLQKNRPQIRSQKHSP